MNFLKSLSIYTIAGFATKGISILLLPFFTNYLSKSEYGILTIFSNSIYFLTPFMAMGVGEILTADYFKMTQEEIGNFISTSLIFPLSIFIISILFVVIGHNGIQSKVGLTTKLQLIIIVISLFTVFIEYGLILFRNENKPIFFALFSFLRTFSELSLAILFIKHLKLGIHGRVYSITFSAFISFSIIIYYLIKRNFLKLNFDKYWFKEIFRRGLPSIPMFLMVFVLGNAGNYMVNYYRGADALGLYGLSWQYAMFINVLTSAFMTPFYPFLYANLIHKEYKKILIVVFSFAGGVFCCSLILIFARFLVFKMFIAPKFIDCIDFIPPLIFSQFFWMLTLLLCGIIFYLRKNYLFYYIAPICIFLNILVNVLMLKNYPIENLGYLGLTNYIICFCVVFFALRGNFVNFFKSNLSNLVYGKTHS